MNHKFIYSKSINSTELLRSLALFGTNTLDTKIFNFNDLLDEVNIRLGFKIQKNVLSKNEIEEKVLNFFLTDVSLDNATYQDIAQFMNTFANIRNYIRSYNEQEEIIKVIKEHNDIVSLTYLKQFVNAYFKALGNDIDSYIFAHEIIEECKKLNKKPFDSICYYKEFELSPLEEELLHAVAKDVEAIEMFKSSDPEIKFNCVEPGYGVRNEVSFAIKDILSKNIPQQDCQIVLTNNDSYVIELYKMMKKYNLDMTFETGLPITLSNAYKLYKSIENLDKKNFFGVNGYLNFFSSEALDLVKLKVSHPKEVAQLLGRMKICFNKEKNDLAISDFKYVRENYKNEFVVFMKKIDRGIDDLIIDEALSLIEEFSKGVSYVISTYTKTDEENVKFNQASIDFIKSSLDYADNKMPQQLKESYLKCIDNKYLCSEVFNDKGIHVTTLSKALSNTRKNIYIMGLNSAYYPGSSTEDFLFSDKLYEELSGVKDLTLTRLATKNEYLKKVIDSYLSLNLNVSISFNAQEVAEVRSMNACSVFLDYAEMAFMKENEKRRAENPSKYEDVLTEKIRLASFYSDELEDISKIAKIAIDNNEVDSTISSTLPAIKQESDGKIKEYKNKKYSPSLMSSFLKCPLSFYIEKLLGASEDNDYDPLNPIDGRRFGDLFHFIMERYIKREDKTSISPEEDAENIVKLYRMIDKSILDNDSQLEDIKLSVKNTVKFLEQFDLSQCKCECGVGYKDKELDVAVIGNIHFHGSIDLVAKDNNGDYFIVDYKTGKKVEHKEDDVDSCIQGLIYAQLYEKIYGIHIKDLIFYYTRLDKKIYFHDPCGTNAKEELENRVNRLYKSITESKFDIADVNDQEEVCKYCKYKMICKK